MSTFHLPARDTRYPSLVQETLLLARAGKLELLGRSTLLVLLLIVINILIFLLCLEMLLLLAQHLTQGAQYSFLFMDGHETL